MKIIKGFLTCSLIAALIVTSIQTVDAANVGQALTSPETGWKRIDDSDSYIKYSNFTVLNDYASWNGSYRYANIPNSKALFYFYGSKLRILSTIWGDGTGVTGSSNIKVFIDEVEYSYSSYGTTTVQQNLALDVNNLTLGNHKVEIITQDNYSVNFDAIDIDDNGYLIPIKVGSQLLTPETGTKRVDNLDPRFTYTGTFTSWIQPTEYYWNGSLHTTSTVGDKIEFQFTGRLLRIIENSYTTRDNSIKITIDGVTEYYDSSSSVDSWYIVVFEKLNLDPGTHSVVIEKVGSSGKYVGIDAIDVEGDLVTPDLTPPNEVYNFTFNIRQQ